MSYCRNMGSFTEISMFFDFVESTPEHVLAAFSALATRNQPDGAPALPTPVAEFPMSWEPDWNEIGSDREPWRHSWATWVSHSMGSATPHARLVRSEAGKCWNLDCRFSWKTEPWAASEALAWLAPYVDPGWRRKVFVGHALYDGGPRPFLFWVEDGRWEMEDLNPEGHWA